MKISIWFFTFLVIFCRTWNDTLGSEDIKVLVTESDSQTRGDSSPPPENLSQKDSENREILSEDTKNDDDDGKTQMRYDGAQLWRILISDEKEKNAVSELENKYDGKIWMAVGEGYDMVVKPEVLEKTERLLKDVNLTHVVLIDDLQQAIDTQNPPPEEIEMLQNRKGHRMTWKAYHRLQDIYGYLDYLAQTYPDLCSIENIGKSVQSRPLRVLKISNKNPNNRPIWIDGGIHAREWISPATVTYIINEIVENWDELPAHMKSIDWYILPVVNPDGYEYTHSNDRLWRKNRSNFGFCAGVDLNRNFGHKWGGPGASRRPCAETYGGSGAFSEPESTAIRNFLTRFKSGHFKGYLTFHSYGQYILYPWGYDRVVPGDYQDLDRVGREAAANMLKVGGARYQVGGSAALLYPAAGGSDDWARAELDIKYPYTVEMRDTGRYGFILPAHMIETASSEGFALVSTIAKAVNKLRK